MNEQDFIEILQEKGRELYRDMPWREDTRPYYVLVSELMLQQTQVDRVVPKFEAFITRFPDEKMLADASLAEVLGLWSGLGYNRRARFLHEAAKKIQTEFDGVFPDTKTDLLSLPGVGEGTSGAILTYAFNQPVLFVETNVRTVYFHHFFVDGEKVSDTEILSYLAATIDKEHPREFYWSLMDYGAWLKKNKTGRISQSSHYRKQTALKGSVREVRGQIIRLLVGGSLSRQEIETQLTVDTRFEKAVTGLIRDGLLIQMGDIFHLTK